jgi:hypothetical protein
MRSTRRLKILLLLCILGSLIGAIGAAFISSGSNEWEDLGLSIHQGGLLVMLLGFGGLLLRGRVSQNNTQDLFQWKHIGDRVVVHPTKASEVLFVSADSLINSQVIQSQPFSKIACEQVLCVVWPKQALSVHDASKLLRLKNLRVLDLSRCSEMSDEAAAELEGLEQAECLMLPSAISAKAFKRLRIALPEAVLNESRQEVIINPLLAIRDLGRAIA